MNRKNIPTKVKEEKLKRSDIIVQHTGSVSVVKRSDEKTVAAIFVFQS
jgi:hypothetical protein